MSAGDFDAIIAGAGIVGAACAYYLSREGRRVLVVDPGEPGQLATAAGMGHIVVMDDSPAQFALTAYSRRLWDALVPSLTADAAYNRTGTLWIAEDDEEERIIQAKARFFSGQRIEIEVLDPAELHRREPNLRPGLRAGLLVPGDSVVFAPAVARWMIAQAAAHGSQFLTGARVVRIENGGVTLSDGRRLKAGATINAAGVDAASLTPGLQIRPRKGHLVLTRPAPGFCRHEIIELGYLKSAHGHGQESVAFNVQPRSSGQILIGSSRQYGSQSPEVEARIIELMMARCRHFMPSIDSLVPERTWTGFRPATPDSLPYIGEHSPGVFVAAGHEGLGITTSLASGRLITDLLLGRKPEIDPAPFSPLRAMKS